MSYGLKWRLGPIMRKLICPRIAKLCMCIHFTEIAKHSLYLCEVRCGSKNNFIRVIKGYVSSTEVTMPMVCCESLSGILSNIGYPSETS